MKKINSICGDGYRLTIMSMFLMFAFVGCVAHPTKEKSNSTHLLLKTDSVMKKAVGDSIYDILNGAKKIFAEEIKFTNDTAKIAESPKCIKAKFVPLIKFVIADPKIYTGNLTTFANFMPCFKLTFVNKKEACILNFDFGLKKWNICDSTGKQIKMFDLSSDDMLRIANMLFPENDLYNNLINTDKR